MSDGTLDLPYVSVCSGIGLLDLAVTRVFPGARPVALVEREAFAIAHLVDKMEAGALHPSPICTDVRELRASDLPNVELLFGGIPCQPHSHAGKQKRKDDDRDLVDEFLRLVRDLEPSVVIVENVAGFVHPGGLGRLLGPLAELGFHAEWGTLRASDVGAPHRRRRVFIVAYRNQRGLEVLGSSRVLDREREALGDDTDGCIEAVGDTDSSGLEGREVCGSQCARECAPWPPGPEGDWSGVPQRLWPTEPYVRGVVDGSAYRVDRLRALGNAVVPQQAEQAIRQLIERIER